MAAGETTDREQVINRKRDIFFTLATLLAVCLNVGGAYLNYVLWSEGLVSHDLYQSLVEMGGLVAALVLLVCLGTTALAYVLGLDPLRKKRPHFRTILLVASFGVFASGYFLGRWAVALDNYLALAVAAIVVGLVAVGWIYGERVLGRMSIGLARKAYENAPATVAFLWSKLGLMLIPSNREAENIMALALARMGKCQGAERYLLQAYEDGARDADLCHALGQVAECQGDLRAAARYYEEAYHLAPSTALFRKLIALLEDIGEKRKALELLSKLPPDERRHWGERIRQLTFEVGSLEEKRNLCREYEHAEAAYSKIVDCYMKILESHPRDVATLEALADLARRHNSQEEEKAWVSQLVGLCPDQPSYRRRLIEISRWQGRMDEVLAQLDTLIDLGEATREERLEAANEHFARANYDRVETILAASPMLTSSMEAAWLLAASHFERGHFEQAQREVERARHLADDDEPDVRSRLTSLEHRLRQYQLERELESLAKAVEENPDDLELRFQYYDRLMARGQADRVVVGLEALLTSHPELLERTLDEIKKLLERNGRNFRLMSYLSDLYLRQGDWDKVYELHREMAEEAVTGANIMLDGVQKILRNNPSHSPSLLFMVHHEAAAGRREEALEYLERYYQAGGARDAEVLQLEFDLAYAIGDETRALTVGQELLPLAAQNKTLLLALAQLWAKRGKFSEAVALATRALALDPQDGAVRALVKQYEESQRRSRIAELRQALTNDPEHDAPLHLELGDLLHDFGEFNEAIVEYQRATLGQTCGNIARAKLGYVLASKGLFGEAEETLNEVQLHVGQPSEESAKLKALLYRAAELMEKSGEISAALKIYKRVFRVDAGYRDVVAKIERLQHMEKKEKK